MAMPMGTLTNMTQRHDTNSVSSPPNVRMYAFSTHDRLLLENPRASWMWGNATFTIVVSSTTISWAARITKRKSLDPAAGRVAGPEESKEFVGEGMDFDLSAGT